SQSEESDKTVPLNEEVNESEKTVSVNKEINMSAEKGVPDNVVDVDDLDSIDQPLNKTFGGISKRLRSSSGKVVPSASKTPATRKKTTSVGPKKGWIKVTA
ncbi:hypothetical protein A2U01_0071576, partial [Trifolium medium]|nr:hypothetical protein [Trifolium medium]